MYGNARNTRFLTDWYARLGGGTTVAHMGRGATTLAVQIAAAHLLGARGLGLVALCLGVIVLSGAVTGGMVGDSLTALDRHDSRVRGALVWWAVVLVGFSAAIGAVALRYGMGLSVTEAVLFGAASVSFQTAEVMRRVLLAMHHFWQLAVIDTVALLSALGSVIILVGERRVALATFLVAVAVGQAMACLTAHALLPLPERGLVVPRGGARGIVAAVGGWRAARAAVNPAVLTATRLVVVVAVGGAALGRLEAARILVVPAFLVLQGLESSLLAAHARDRGAPLAALVSRARRTALALGVAIVAGGVLLGLAAPHVGHLISGSSFPVSGLAVLGWAVYAASLASLQPFTSLAAARSGSRAVLAVRGADVAVSIGVLVAMLFVLDLPPAVVPFALAAGPLLCGLLTRQLLLRPLVRGATDHGERPTPVSTPASSGSTVPDPERDLAEAVHQDH